MTTAPPRPAGRALPAIVLGVAIIATAVAFAVAQRLKRSPALVYDVSAVERFSPALQTGTRQAEFRFRVRRADELRLSIVTRQGDLVRELGDPRDVAVGDVVRGAWDGSDDDGAPAPDGEYRVRVTLGRAARAVDLPTVLLVKDTTPPMPKLLSVGPERTGDTPRPELLPRPDGQPVRVRYRTGGREAAIAVLRTDLAEPRTVLEEPVPVPEGGGSGTWEWNGTVDGRRVAQGTYLVAVRAKDQIGNVGWSTGPAGPVPGYGERLDANGGVTIRYLAARSPEAPVASGQRAGIGVIAPGLRYRWSVRRAGEARDETSGRSASAFLRPRMPDGPSGLHVFEARTSDRVARATVLTDAPDEERVLVVVPHTSLIGAARVDDDGDGAPDTLARGMDVETGRVPIDDELPADVTERIAPLLIALDRRDRRYDLTTDLALARGLGPRLSGHRGVVLAGTASFTDRTLQEQLRAWVERGGRLWVAEPGSLQRSVEVTDDRATRPTQPSSTDAFGFELGDLLRVPAVTQLEDEASLLRGTDGRFEGPLLVEPVDGLPPGARSLTEATTPGGGELVYVAARIGEGAVVRSGISGLGARSLRDADAREALRRLWSFLRNA